MHKPLKLDSLDLHTLGRHSIATIWSKKRNPNPSCDEVLALTKISGIKQVEPGCIELF